MSPTHTIPMMEKKKGEIAIKISTWKREKQCLVTTSPFVHLVQQGGRGLSCLEPLVALALPSGASLVGAQPPCRPVWAALGVPAAGGTAWGGGRLFSPAQASLARPVAGFLRGWFPPTRAPSDTLLGAGLGLGPAGPHRPVSRTEDTVTAPLRDFPVPGGQNTLLAFQCLCDFSCLVFFLL